MKYLYATASLVAHAWDVSLQVLAFFLALLASGIGWWFKQRRRRLAAEAAERAYVRELLRALVEWAQVSIEESLWRDFLTSTQRQHPLDDATVAERRGAYKQMRQDAADHLRAVLRNERRAAPGSDRSKQDVFRRSDLTREERQET